MTTDANYESIYIYMTALRVRANTTGIRIIPSRSRQSGHRQTVARMCGSYHVSVRRQLSGGGPPIIPTSSCHVITPFQGTISKIDIQHRNAITPKSRFMANPNETLQTVEPTHIKP